MPVDWVDGYLDAWNSHDSSRMASLMAEDVIYDDLASGLVHQGRDAVQAYVEPTIGFSSDYRFVPVSTGMDRSRYAIEWEMLGTNTKRPAGFPATAKPHRIRGASTGELGADGKITANRGYWNLAAYRRSVCCEFLRRRPSP